MKVSELINKLKHYPDVEVCTEFEGSYDPVTSIEITKDDNDKDIIVIW